MTTNNFTFTFYVNPNMNSRSILYPDQGEKQLIDLGTQVSMNIFNVELVDRNNNPIYSRLGLVHADQIDLTLIKEVQNERSM